MTRFVALMYGDLMYRNRWVRPLVNRCGRIAVIALTGFLLVVGLLAPLGRTCSTGPTQHR